MTRRVFLFKLWTCNDTLYANLPQASIIPLLAGVGYTLCLHVIFYTVQLSWRLKFLYTSYLKCYFILARKINVGKFVHKKTNILIVTDLAVCIYDC